jgi:ankyrin repeat protein
MFEDFIIRGHLGIIKHLVNNGANMNAKDSDQNTPIHLASEYGNDHVLPFLLDKNPDLKIKNNHGKVAMDLAMNYNTLQVFSILI